MVRTGRNAWVAFLPICLGILLLAGLTPAVCPAEPSPATLTLDRQLSLGEQIYRTGVLPSGEAMQAVIKGDLFVQGTAFTCVSCHLRSGMGCLEGGILTPPTNGVTLFKPAERRFKGYEQKYFPFPPKRTAYDDVTLAEAIRNGVMPDGRELNDVMPRYTLNDNDMALLITYLKNLSARFSPGIGDSTIHLATVISEDVSPADRDALMVPLENYIRLKNNAARAYEQKGGAKSRQMAESMLISKEVATRRLTLSRWVVKGPPGSWRTQLEEFNRKEPVFALLGGMTDGEWRPVHEFCEDNRIPCLFPLTDFPVVSGSDWYTLYFSKGYYQEGEGAARYLNSVIDTLAGRPIIQIVRDSRAGRALADGFGATWHDLGHPAARTVTLGVGERLNPERIRTLATGEAPVLLVWDGADSLPDLEQLVSGPKPPLLIVSGRYLDTALWGLPERLRGVTRITFPYTFSPLQGRPAAMSMGSAVPVQDDNRATLTRSAMKQEDRAWRIGSLATSITQMLTMALMDLWGNYYRDNLLDVISMEPDQPSGVFGRLSFGPNQRFASKGCYIVQLGPGATPELIKKSGWLTY